MFNIGAGEMIFILVAALLILGPQRLPELARGIGKFLREFRRQTDDVRTVVMREFYQMDQDFQREPPRPTPPPAAPLQDPVTALPAVLPSLSALPSPSEVLGAEGAAGHPPEPLAVAAVAPEAAPGAVPAKVEGEGAEHEEPLPSFAPVPGTVARNTPKQG
ncbi:twin-arginine translocase TatA/TatE family subunit [Stigmatella aurantiaca]|uniref:Twin-arginine translocation protein TatB n=1 Tax=Stigmatella aurantiaca (strain DW4/3-1) TaxID=378806 RepID=E3FLQ7_STIAD|nr:twin-arginine translocase TatA/TatE family subunit [Stigmatella aurantiaca]ADO74321.1 twin-arginine translocation protein TatB [Stigmatella aurantiaca DW4/3-1]